jgi:hypothetical protein
VTADMAADSPRYYVAALGFAWAVHDRTQGDDPRGPHARVAYFREAEAGSWAAAHALAVAECERLNAQEAAK